MYQDDIFEGECSTTPIYDDYCKQLQKKEWEACSKGGREAWAEKQYKIYPSDLRFGSCLWDLVYKKGPSKRDPMGLAGKLTTQQGKAWHWQIQRDLPSSKRMLTKDDFVWPSEKHRLEQEEKFHKNDPEYPCRDYDSGISGWVDFRPYKLPSGIWTIIDVKHTTADPDPKGLSGEQLERALKKYKDWDQVGEIKNRDYLTQLLIYAFITKDQGLFPKADIQAVTLMSANLYYPAPSPNRVRETTVLLTEHYRGMYDRFRDGLVRIRDMYIRGEERGTDPCHKDCFQCNKKRVKWS